MRLFGRLLSFEEARRMVDANMKPVARVEAIGIDGCLNRVLAEAITARRSTPPFNRAAMDGYAVRARETFGVSRQNPGVFKIVDSVYAGQTPQRRLAAGECIQIATGARVPPGADAVVMFEDVNQEDDRIEVLKPLYPQANIAPKGEDIKRGQLLLEEGCLLAPAQIGVLASQGLRRVRVYEKPLVAVIPTGEEIVEVGRRLRPEQIYDINTYTLSSVVRENGCRPIRFASVSDAPDEIRATMKKALESDLVVISGGSSVGERDLLFDILNKWGSVLFHGIQIKPGKPTTFALVGDKPVLVMPGNPTSCLINAYILLLPALRKMARLPPKRSLTVSARLGERVAGSVGRRQFLPVRLEGDIALPIFKGSGAITATAGADGYIVVAENTDILEKGAPVTVTLF